jgi:hypothetical protein
MVKPRVRSLDDWRIVEEVRCENGDNDRAIRDFGDRRPDLASEPKRLRIEILSQRDSGSSTVRFLWNHATPETSTQRKREAR